MTHKDISIIIVSFNTCEILKNCINSLYTSNLNFLFEIIVVDNASTDSSVQMIESHFTDVILIKNSINLMFSKANNVGIKQAKGEYVLLLNSDTIVTPNQLEKLLFFLKKNPHISAVGPRILNFNGTIQSESFPFDDFRNLICNYLKLSKWPISNFFKLKLLPPGFIGFQNGYARKTSWISGCCMLINKDKLQNCIGYLDEDLLFYGEDVEWCYRAKKRGELVYILPQSEIIHLGGASTNGEVELIIKKNISNNYIKYLKKTIGPFQMFNINMFILICHLFISPFLLICTKQYYIKWKKNILLSINIIKGSIIL